MDTDVGTPAPSAANFCAAIHAEPVIVFGLSAKRTIDWIAGGGMGLLGDDAQPPGGRSFGGLERIHGLRGAVDAGFEGQATTLCATVHDVDVHATVLPITKASGEVFSVIGVIRRIPTGYPPDCLARIGSTECGVPRSKRVAALEDALANARRLLGEALGSANDVLPQVPELALLSAREREIALLLARNRRVPTIARELYLSQSTVRNHLSRIYRKFGVSSQVQLIERLARGQNDETTISTSDP